jgi:hypothetical protein
MINPIIHFDQLAPGTNYNICASCQGINKICKQIKTSSMVMILSNTKKMIVFFSMIGIIDQF